MTLLILDSNVLDMIQPGEHLHYVTRLCGVECIPARLAREEAEVSGISFETPLDSGQDATVPIITNCAGRCLNDQAVVIISQRFSHLLRKIKRTVYSRSTTSNHQNDQAIITSAILLWEKRMQADPSLNAYFVSGDILCCKKAKEFFNQERFSLKVLFVRRIGGGSVPGLEEFGEVFPPQ